MHTTTPGFDLGSNRRSFTTEVTEFTEKTLEVFLPGLRGLCGDAFHFR